VVHRTAKIVFCGVGAAIPIAGSIEEEDFARIRSKGVIPTEVLGELKHPVPVVGLWQHSNECWINDAFQSLVNSSHLKIAHVRQPHNPRINNLRGSDWASPVFPDSTLSPS
jgi:hypothetical protein